MVDLEENCLSAPAIVLPCDLHTTVNRLREEARAHKIWNNSACFEQGKEIKNGILLNLEIQRKIVSSWFRNLLQTTKGFFFHLPLTKHELCYVILSFFPPFQVRFLAVWKKSYSLSKNDIIYMIYISHFNLCTLHLPVRLF